MMNLQKIVLTLNARKKEWTAIAAKSGVSRKTIERIAGNKTDPRVSILQKIYLALK